MKDAPTPTDAARAKSGFFNPGALLAAQPANTQSLFYGGLFFILMCLFDVIGKDLLNNPTRTGVSDDPYGEMYQRVRYLEFGIVILISLGQGSQVIRRAAAMGRDLWPFILVATASIFWTVDPWITARYACMLIGYTYTVGFLTVKLGPQGLTRALLYFLAFVVLVSTIAAIAFPEIGRHSASDVTGLAHLGKWRGIFANKNALGPYAALGSVLFFTHGYVITRSPFILWTLRLSAIACLIFCKSSNSLLGAVVMVLMYLILRPKRPMSFGVFILGGIITLSLMLILPDVIAALVGRDATFTGRTEIWHQVLEVWSDSPIIGYGYAAANENVLAPRLMGGVFESAVDAHNAYFDIMIDLGVLGLGAFLYALWRTLSQGYQVVTVTTRGDRAAYIAMMMIFVAGCVMAVGEVSPFRLLGNGGATFIFTIISLRDRPAVSKIIRYEERLFSSRSYDMTDRMTSPRAPKALD